MITIDHVTKKYGRAVALEDICCNIDNGSIYGLIGYNGAGKTTLLKTICGIYRPEAGKVTVDGRAIYEDETLKRQFFIMTEELYFLPQADLMAMRQFYRGYYATWNDHTFDKLVQLFGLDVRKKISGFSKGMQRQAGLILAFAVRPAYLLLDEAFDGLDLAMRLLMKKLLDLYVAKTGATVVITSHNLRELEGIVDKIGMIKDQRLFLDASVTEMRQRCHKYQFTLAKGLDSAVLQKLAHKRLQRQDNGFVSIMEGAPEAVTRQIQEVGGQDIRVSDITLEEFFLNEREQTFDAWETIF